MLTCTISIATTNVCCGSTDLFVHISAVEKAGYTNLVEGARISYELVAGRSGKKNLRLG
jgi:CspA family cold shock protein